MARRITFNIFNSKDNVSLFRVTMPDVCTVSFARNFAAYTTHSTYTRQW